MMCLVLSLAKIGFFFVSGCAVCMSIRSKQRKINFEIGIRLIRTGTFEKVDYHSEKLFK